MNISGDAKYKLLVFGLLLAVAMLALAWSGLYVGPRAAVRDPPLLFPLKTVVTSISLVSSGILLFIYGRILRRRKSRFTMGLLLVAGALFFSAFTSNPIVASLIGWRMFGFGDIVVASNIFTCIAILGLLYVSME